MTSQPFSSLPQDDGLGSLGMGRLATAATVGGLTAGLMAALSQDWESDDDSHEQVGEDRL